jgi:DNA-directed RNA polymerase specialized sigma24 family protein
VRHGVGGGLAVELRLQEECRLLSVEQAILPKIDAADNLARWLTATDQDTKDVMHEACLRAIKFLPGYQGGDTSQQSVSRILVGSRGSRTLAATDSVSPSR